MTTVTGDSAATRPGLGPDDDRLCAALVRVTTAALSVAAVVWVARCAEAGHDPVVSPSEESSPAPAPRRVSFPLVAAAGDPLGVLHASTDEAQGFTDADLSLLLDAAETATVLLTRVTSASASSKSNDDRDGRYLLDTVLSASDCGIMACDINGDLVIANGAAGVLSGLEAGHSADHRSNAFKLFAPDGTQLPQSEWPLIRALTGAEVDGRIVCIPTPDGKFLYHRCSARQLSHADGTVFGAICIFSDITDLYRRTEELQADRDRAELIISAASDGFFSFDADGLIEEWNLGAERLFGFDRDEIVGQRFDHSIVTEESGRDLRAGLAAGGTFELRATTKTGQVLDAEISGWITETDGAQSHSVFVRDITERKALEISQTRAYDELTQALDSIRRNIALVKVIRDDNGEPDHLVISWLNRFMLDVFGLSLSQAEGRPLAEVFPGVAAAGFQDRYLEVARTGEPLHAVVDDFDDGIVSGAFELSATPWSLDGLLIEVTNITQQRTAELAMERSERMLANSHRAAGIGSFEYDLVRDSGTWSSEMFTIYGVDPADGPLVREKFRSLVHPDDLSCLDQRAADIAAGMARHATEYRIVLADGSIKHLADWIQIETDSQGQLIRITGAVQDQTERREREIALAHSRELERLVVDLSPIGIALLDENGNFIKVNNAFCAMQGRTRDALLHTNFIDVSHPDERENALAKHAQVASGKLVGANYDERYIHANGRPFWVSVHKTLLQAADSPYPPRILAQVIDISDRQQRADELTRQARTDQLTGLANRRTWEPRLQSALTEAQKNGTPLSVAIFDLDKFKQFNDTYGHPVGDELLAETSAAWRAYMIRHAPRGLVARLGGEEFGVLLPRCDAEAASKLLAGMSAVVQRGQTASAGFAVALPSDDVHTIMTRADTALYAAKNAGRARVEFGAAA